MNEELKRYRGRCRALELRLNIALSLLTRLQRAQYDKAYYKTSRKKAADKSKLVVRRKFEGYVPGQEVAVKATGKPISDRMSFDESRIDVC